MSKASLPTGKVPYDVIQRCVLGKLGFPSDRVIKGPEIGEDAPIIDMCEKVLVVKANPITGAEKGIGSLVVHVNANDVATRGAKPLWFSSVILLPEGATEAQLDEITTDIHVACHELGVQVIGGHTECVSGLMKPIVAGFMLGEAPRDRYIITGGAKSGDKIILTKSAGLEGAGILATDLEDRLEEINKRTIRRARKAMKEISSVAEALTAVETGGVHSLHTPTEGGVINGLWEMASASDLGVYVEENLIPISVETKRITSILEVDPLRLLSSGSLLIAAEKGMASKIITSLASIGVEAVIIGEFLPKEDGLHIRGGDKVIREIVPVKQDELYRILA